MGLNRLGGQQQLALENEVAMRLNLRVAGAGLAHPWSVAVVMAVGELLWRVVAG